MLQVSSLLGYAEVVQPEVEVSNILAYVEYSGSGNPTITPDLFNVSSLLGYVEYEPVTPAQVSSLLGYADVVDPRSHITGLLGYADLNFPFIQTSGLLAYVEYSGTGSPTITPDLFNVSSILAYAEYQETPKALISLLSGYVEAVNFFGPQSVSWQADSSQSAYLESISGFTGNSRQSVYLLACQQDSQQAAYFRGHDHLTHNQTAFIIGGLDSRVSAYMDAKVSPFRVVIKEFASPTATGNISITDSDLGGMTPKAAQIIMTSARGSGVVYDYMMHSFGVTTGPGQEWNIANFMGRGRVPNLTSYIGPHRTFTNDRVIYIYNFEDDSLWRTLQASVVSFIPDGITLNFTAVSNQARRGYVIFYAGDDLQVSAGLIQQPTTTNGTINIHCGFRPEVIWFQGSGFKNSTTSVDTNPGYQAGLYNEMGFYTDKDAKQVSQDIYWYTTVDDQLYGSASIRDTGYLVEYDNSEIYQVSATNNNGFTSKAINPYTSNAFQTLYFALGFSGNADYSIVEIDTPLTHGPYEIVTNFKGTFAFILTNLLTSKNTQINSENIAAFGYGIICGNRERSFAFAGEFNDAYQNSQILTDGKAVNLPNNVGNKTFLGTFDGWTNNGFKIDFSELLDTPAKWTILTYAPKTTSYQKAFLSGFSARSNQHAYLASQVKPSLQPIFLKSWLDDTSSAHAFIPYNDNGNTRSYARSFLQSIPCARQSAYLNANISTFKIVVKEFNIPTSTGSINVTSTDLGGLTPKAAIVFGTYGAALGTYRSSMGMSFGITSGADKQWTYSVAGGRRGDGSGPYTSGRCLANRILALGNYDNTPNWTEIQATSTGFITNGITLNFTIVDSALSRKGFIIFFAGDGLKAKADVIQQTMITNGTVVSHCGFRPEFVYFLGSSWGDYVFDNQGTTGWCISDDGLFLAKTPQQYSRYARFFFNSGIGYGFSSIRDNGYMIRYDVSDHFQVSAFNNNSFTTKTVNPNSSILQNAYLALDFSGNADIALTEIDTPTQTGLYEFTTGFKPLFAMMFMSQMANKNTQYIDGSSSVLGYSLLNGSNEYSIAYHMQDGGSIFGTLADDQAVNFFDHTGAESFLGTLDSWTENGFKIDFSAVPATSKKWLVWSIAPRTTSYQPAFLNGLLRSSQHAFIFSAAYYSNTPVYLSGIDSTQSSAHACIPFGELNTSSQTAYLFGQVQETSSNGSYLAGTADTTSQTSAFLECGAHEKTSTPVYLSGKPSISQISSYLCGLPRTIPAYLLGGGLSYPFSDDFTGVDYDPWNETKWFSDSQ